MRKKEYLAQGMAMTGLHGLCSFLRSLRPGELPILAYHRVCDIGDEAAFPFDPDLVSASCSAFAWQMQYLKDRYDPITFRTLLDSLDGKARLPARPVIVTFDDGYDDNYLNAFPVLRSLGMPATIFVSTGYIGSGKPFWFDLVAHILHHAPVGTLTVPDLDMSLTLGAGVDSRRAAASRLVGALKRVSNARRLNILDQLERQYAGAMKTTEFRLSHPLDWNQIREMSAAGIEFSSHTVSHPILSRLDDDDLERELTDSRQRLEQELGKPAPVLAYPVGGPEEFNDKVVRAAGAAGYRLGVSYMPGVNRLAGMDRFRLRRQHVERYVSNAWFSGLLSLPEIFH
jgi:peptidoglycan/xylan/chitin deacetylase (PgdA/CDA1 family)